MAKVKAKKTTVKKAAVVVKEDQILVGYKGNAKNVEYAGQSFTKGSVHPVPANLKKAIELEGMKEAGFYIKSTSKKDVKDAVEATKTEIPTEPEPPAPKEVIEE